MVLVVPAAPTYDYATTEGRGFFAIEGDVDGEPFGLVVQTLGLVLGRDNPENDVPFVGCHVLLLHRSETWIVNVLRPLGYPAFDALAWSPLDVTRVGFCGIKKLSRSHLMLSPADAPGRWHLISLSMNGVLVADEPEKLEENAARTIASSTSLRLCAGILNLKIVLDDDRRGA